MHYIRTIIVALGIGLSLSGCARPTLLIASDAAFPPFNYIDANGEPTGFDIELARVVADRAGYEPEFVVVTPYAALYTGLEAEDFDLIVATTGITAERLEKYFFTSPYFQTCQAVIVREGAGEPITLADLQGRPIGAPQGTTSVLAAHGLGAGNVVEIAGADIGIATLLDGQIDAYVADEFEAVKLAEENPSLYVLSQPAALEEYGMVMIRGRSDLRAQLNEALRQVRIDGTNRRLQKVFNLNRPDDWPINLNEATGE